MATWTSFLFVNVVFAILIACVLYSYLISKWIPNRYGTWKQHIRYILSHIIKHITRIIRWLQKSVGDKIVDNNESMYLYISSIMLSILHTIKKILRSLQAAT